MNKLFFLLALLALSSCSLLPNRMFKTPKEYTFATDTSTAKEGPYIIQAEDKITLRIFSNDGFRLVDITSSTLSTAMNSEATEYLVEVDGQVKLPVIGRVMLKGMPIKDAENFLQEKYAQYYKEPFVMLKVVSRKAIVFLGDGGPGTVVPLTNDHTSLFEALALAGGLSEYSKAFDIKIVRGDYKNPQIYHADISSVEALKTSELKIYPNDIIYVDVTMSFGRRLNNEVLPYLTLITSVLVLVALFK